MSRDPGTILQICNACEAIIEFTSGLDFKDFEIDRKTQSAVLHQLLIVGEGSKRLSQEFCDTHRNIEWSLMAKMRDKLIHGYDQIDLQLVWETATSDIPALLPKLKAIK